MAGFVRSWLELFRIPNWLTVPAEPLAGILLAFAYAPTTDEPWLPVILACICLYAGGIGWNDYFDRGRDLLRRPERPIPSGRVGPRQVLWSSNLLIVAGLIICSQISTFTLWLGLILVLVIYCYDRHLKRLPGLGALAMGSCRGLSVLLGASAVLGDARIPLVVWLAAGIVTLYVAAITQAAKGEALPRNPGSEVWGPFIALLLGLILYVPFVQIWSPTVIGLLAVVLALPLAAAIRLHALRTTRNLPRTLAAKELAPTILPRWIGWLIAHLLWLSAFFILSAGPTDPATTPALASLAGCWLGNRLLSSLFYSS